MKRVALGESLEIDSCDRILDAVDEMDPGISTSPLSAPQRRRASATVHTAYEYVIPFSVTESLYASSETGRKAATAANTTSVSGTAGIMPLLSCHAYHQQGIMI